MIAITILIDHVIFLTCIVGLLLLLFTMFSLYTKSITFVLYKLFVFWPVAIYYK